MTTHSMEFSAFGRFSAFLNPPIWPTSVNFCLKAAGDEKLSNEKMLENRLIGSKVMKV